MDLGDVRCLNLRSTKPARRGRPPWTASSKTGMEQRLVKAYLTNHKLKELTPEERLSIPDFDKVISFRLVSLQSLNFPWKR